jgi:hypothetical protein
MEATRVGIGEIFEWALAAVLIAVAVVAGSAFVREARTVRAVVPVIAGEAHLYYDAPADIPARAVSVPLVLLRNGQQVRVGDAESELAAQTRGATLVSQSTERTATRQRVTRFYSDVGVQFAVVLELSDPNAEPRVAAIYLR